MRSTFLAKLGLSYLVFATVVGPFTTLAQTQRPAEQQTQDRIVITKDEVPLDVVVRDKKGKLIKDLTASDFEVYEDGAKQEIASFRYVSSTAADTVTTTNNQTGPSSVTVATEKNSSAPNEAASVSAVALVFDRLSPEARLRARDAALSYLGESVKKSELVGVFLTDLSVVVLLSHLLMTHNRSSRASRRQVYMPPRNTRQTVRNCARREMWWQMIF